MPNADIFEAIERIRRTGAPFCVATVVRTADATSAKAGAKAIVSAAGEIEGHLGGACIKRAVRAAAGSALESGMATLIRVKPSEHVDSAQDIDGVRLYRSGCPSGGTVDILIEAYRPPPLVAIFGRTEIARAVAAQARLCGLRVAVPAEIADGAEVAVFKAGEVDGLGLGADDFIVIASQGEDDAEALRAALGSGAGRISMVASRRKAETLLRRVQRSDGGAIDPARVKSPAGIDLGGVDPGEIALSIVAEIVAWRRMRRPETETADLAS